MTEQVLQSLPELNQFSVGLCHVLIQHTSASITLNENWDRDVREDMESFMNTLVPEVRLEIHEF